MHNGEQTMEKAHFSPKSIGKNGSKRLFWALLHIFLVVS